MANGAVRLDAVAATHNGKLVNFRAGSDYQNGFVFTLGDLVSGQRDIYNAVTPVTANLDDSVYLAASVELNYDAGKTITDFVLKTGETGRGVLLEQGDVVTITDNVIDGTPVVGKYLIPQNNSNKLVVAADLSGGTKFAAKIVELESIYGQAATVIRVLQN